jgi:hypothetical protein
MQNQKENKKSNVNKNKLQKVDSSMITFYLQEFVIIDYQQGSYQSTNLP